MVTVETTTRVNIGKRVFVLKTVNPLITMLQQAQVEGTATQLKLMAFGARDLMIDKLLAYDPPQGKALLEREPDAMRKGKRTVPKEPPHETRYDKKSIEEDTMEEQHLLPARTLDRPRVKRRPFPKMPLLSKKYVVDKVRKKLDPRILMASGEYLRGILVRKVHSPDTGVHYIVRMANRNHASGIKLNLLARIMEYGTSAFTIKVFGDENKKATITLPPRKHWAPAFKEVMKARKQLGEEVRAEKLEKLLLDIV